MRLERGKWKREKVGFGGEEGFFVLVMGIWVVSLSECFSERKWSKRVFKGQGLREGKERSFFFFFFWELEKEKARIALFGCVLVFCRSIYSCHCPHFQLAS